MVLDNVILYFCASLGVGWQNGSLYVARAEAIVLASLGIILLNNSHNFAYYAHTFYLFFSKLYIHCYCSVHLLTLNMYQNNKIHKKLMIVGFTFLNLSAFTAI